MSPDTETWVSWEFQALDHNFVVKVNPESEMFNRVMNVPTELWLEMNRAGVAHFAEKFSDLTMAEMLERVNEGGTSVRVSLA